MDRFKLIVAIGMFLCAADAIAAQKTVYRDSLGRRQGTMETDRYGKATYRDEQGRRQGSSTTDRNGKTTYRDAQGRIQGTRK